MAQTMNGCTVMRVAAGSIIVGNGNTLTGTAGPFTVIGNDNVLRGEGLFVRGDRNTIHAKTIGRVTGKDNLFTGLVTLLHAKNVVVSFTGRGMTITGDYKDPAAAEAPAAYWPATTTVQARVEDGPRREALQYLRSRLNNRRAALVDRRNNIRARHPGNIALVKDVERDIDIVKDAVERVLALLEGTDEVTSVDEWKSIEQKALETVNVAEARLDERHRSWRDATETAVVVDEDKHPPPPSPSFVLYAMPKAPEEKL